MASVMDSMFVKFCCGLFFVCCMRTVSESPSTARRDDETDHETHDII